MHFISSRNAEKISAALAQLGERQTEDLKAPCSIHGGGIYFCLLTLKNTFTGTTFNYHFLTNMFFTRNFVQNHNRASFRWYTVGCQCIIPLL